MSYLKSSNSIKLELQECKYHHQLLVNEIASLSKDLKRKDMLLKESNNKINQIEFEFTTFQSNNMLTINNLNNQINQKDCEVASFKKTIDILEKTILDNKNNHSKLQETIENEIKQREISNNDIKLHFEKEKEFEVNMMMVIEVINKWDSTLNGVLLEDSLISLEIVVKIERIQGKIDKISRLRDIFEAKTKIIIESIADIEKYTSDKIPTSLKNITIISDKVDTLENIITHDRNTRQLEIKESKDFRENIIKGYKETELVQHRKALELEKSIAEYKEKKQKDFKKEIKVKDTIIEELNKKILMLTKVEQLSIQYKKQTISLQENINELNKENVRLTLLNNDFDKKLTMLENEWKNKFDDVIRDKQSASNTFENKIKKLLQENGKLKETNIKLKAREIDPILAQTILATQALIHNEIGVNKNNQNFNNNNIVEIQSNLHDSTIDKKNQDGYKDDMSPIRMSNKLNLSDLSNNKNNNNSNNNDVTTTTTNNNKSINNNTHTSLYMNSPVISPFINRNNNNDVTNNNISRNTNTNNTNNRSPMLNRSIISLSRDLNSISNKLDHLSN